MKKAFFTLVALVISYNGFAQTNSQLKPSSYQANEQQWEYLVVSFGKTEFSTPEKTLAYKIVGVIDGTESTTLQGKIDILGRFGWELVNTVGAIGGDQELIFKRKYDRIRTANEYGLIKSGKEVYLKDLQDIIERSLRLEEEQKKYEEQIKNKPRLIDLDKVDAANKRVEFLKSINSIYKDALSKTDIASKSTIIVDYKGSYSDDLSVIIDVDLTDKFLTNGSNYRSIEINKFLEEFLISYRFRDNSIPKYNGVSIKVRGFIKFNGESNNILTLTNSQSFNGSGWSNY